MSRTKAYGPFAFSLTCIILHAIFSSVYVYFDSKPKNRTTRSLLQCINGLIVLEVWKSMKIGRPTFEMQQIRILEGCLESAPQALIQLYYILQYGEGFADVIVLISLSFSMIALSTIATSVDYYAKRHIVFCGKRLPFYTVLDTIARTSEICFRCFLILFVMYYTSTRGIIAYVIISNFAFFTIVLSYRILHPYSRETDDFEKIAMFVFDKMDKDGNGYIYLPELIEFSKEADISGGRTFWNAMENPDGISKATWMKFFRDPSNTRDRFMKEVILKMTAYAESLDDYEIIIEDEGGAEIDEPGRNVYKFQKLTKNPTAEVLEFKKENFFLHTGTKCVSMKDLEEMVEVEFIDPDCSLLVSKSDWRELIISYSNIKQLKEVTYVGYFYGDWKEEITESLESKNLTDVNTYQYSSSSLMRRIYERIGNFNDLQVSFLSMFFLHPDFSRGIFLFLNLYRIIESLIFFVVAMMYFESQTEVLFLSCLGGIAFFSFLLFRFGGLFDITTYINVQERQLDYLFSVQQYDLIERLINRKEISRTDCIGYGEQLRSKINFSIETGQKMNFLMSDYISFKFTCQELQEHGFGCLHLFADGEGFSINDILASGFTLQSFQRAGVSVAHFRTIASILDLQEAGWSIQDFKDSNYDCKQIVSAQKEFHLKDFRAAGYTYKDLKSAGVTATQFKENGKDVKLMKRIDFTLEQLRTCFTLKELRQGYTSKEIISGSKNAYTPQEYVEAGFTLKKLRKYGVQLDPQTLQNTKVKYLKALGFSISEVLSAMNSKETINFREIIDAGYDLPRHQQYSLKQFVDGGLFPMELTQMGFSDKELRQFFTLDDFKKSDFTFSAIMNAGFDVQEVAKDIPDLDTFLSSFKCNVNTVFNTGFSRTFPLSEFRIKELRFMHVRRRGFSLRECLDAGYSVRQLRKAFTIPELLEENVNLPTNVRKIPASTLAENGCSAHALHAAGYEVEDFRAYCSAKELCEIGISAEKLKLVKYPDQDIARAGYKFQELMEAGVDWQAIVNSGFSLNEFCVAGVPVIKLKAARFEDREIIQAGYELTELVNANIGISSILQSGYTLKECYLARCDVIRLKSRLTQAGYSIVDLVRAGYAIADLLKAYDPETLLKSDIPAEDFEKDGYVFTVNEIMYTDVDSDLLLEKGFNVAKLARAGWTGEQLVEQGFYLDDFKAVDYRPGQIEEFFEINDFLEVGYEPLDLIRDGFNMKRLIRKNGEVFRADLFRKSGVQCNYNSLKQQKVRAKFLFNAGFRTVELARFGFPAKELRDELRLNLQELQDLHYSGPELYDAGFNLRELLEVGFPLADFDMDARVKSGIPQQELMKLGKNRKKRKKKKV